MNENTPDCTNHLPLIGDMAPQFTAHTTNGTVNFPTDYAGRWVILFSHPMDFTPVCTTEFLAFQTLAADFKKINTEIIGLSVGAVSSHLAWFQSIYNDITVNNYKNVQITFPLIADLDLNVSKLYGMIHPNASGTTTVRAVFIIDPHGVIRTILYYPQNIGRNIQEILRTVIALQTYDAFGTSTPANWMPGAPVLESAPQTNTDMRKRIDSKNKNMLTWYLTLRNLPEPKIYDKLTRTKKKK